MTKSTPIVEVAVVTPVPTERLIDLLCNALEGGSNYWYMIEKADAPVKTEFMHEIPFEGGALYISDTEGYLYTSKKPFKLDWEAIVKGVQVFATVCPKDFNDLLTENDDSNTADCFLQCCVYGEVVFG